MEVQHSVVTVGPWVRETWLYRETPPRLWVDGAAADSVHLWVNGVELRADQWALVGPDLVIPGLEPLDLIHARYKAGDDDGREPR